MAGNGGIRKFSLVCHHLQHHTHKVQWSLVQCYTEFFARKTCHQASHILLLTRETSTLLKVTVAAGGLKSNKLCFCQTSLSLCRYSNPYVDLNSSENAENATRTFLPF